ncbi:transporter substrate-binding domain-containing protein, partial [Vibrio parahaemolyticus]|nr:transporter substrate-binding domain-containing protein [Vibrio parahaemolyticus]
MLSILRSITVSSVALIFLASSFCSTAKQSPKPKVIVGVIAQDEAKDSFDGSVGPSYGISLEYLSNITKALDYELELRTYKHIPSLLADVESKKIDGAVGFSKTAAREKRFLFSMPFFSSTIAVWYRNA